LQFVKDQGEKNDYRRNYFESDFRRARFFGRVSFRRSVVDV
jgi:hypothetical protein